LEALTNTPYETAGGEDFIGTPPRHDQRRGEERRSADRSCRLLAPDVFGGSDISCAIAFEPGATLLTVALFGGLGGRPFGDQLKTENASSLPFTLIQSSSQRTKRSLIAAAVTGPATLQRRNCCRR
jgi:hypothetical protein